MGKGKYMIKIACVGCSWTEGVQHDGKPINKQETYPYALARWLKQKDINNTVYNAGRAACGISFYPFVADYLLEEFDPDIFVIQITTHDRSMLMLDPILDKEKKMTFGWDEDDVQYYKIWDNNTNLVHLSPGIGASASKHSDVNQWSDFVEHLWKTRIKNRVTPELTYDAFKNYVATWWEQSKDSHYQSYFYYQQTYTLIDHLEALGKKVIPFYWINYKPKLKTNMFPVRQFPSVENLFDDATFKSLQIDNGYHFGKEGNTRLVQEFLGPQVLETMK